MFSQRKLLVTCGLMLAATAWAYWSTLLETAERWIADPQYSHGWVVPLFSIYLLYRRRKLIPLKGFTPQWWGLLITAFALFLRGLSVWMYQPWLDAGSLLLCLTGLGATLGGRAGLRWVWPAVLFLGFMIPLPYRLQSVLGGQLQTVATVSSTYLLQTLGVPAISEGNVILLTNPPPLGVEEACNGLGMLVTFFALSVGFALLIKRHWIYHVIMIAAAIPIAVAVNVIRITITGVLYEMNQQDTARKFFHDGAGLMMPVLGVLMLAALLYLTDRSLRRPTGK